MSIEASLARIHLLACQTSGDISGMIVKRRLWPRELALCLERLEEASRLIRELVAQPRAPQQTDQSTSISAPKSSGE